MSPVKTLYAVLIALALVNVYALEAEIIEDIDDFTPTAVKGLPPKIIAGEIHYSRIPS